MHSLQVKLIKTNGIDSFKTDEGSRNLFSEVWNNVAFTIGIKKPLVEQELKIIYEFIMFHFKTLTLNDVRDAFSLYSAQKLDFKNSHYQSLDNTFIGCVLSSYKEHKAKQNLLSQFVKDKEEIKSLVYSTNIGEDSYNSIKEVFEKEGKEPFIANWTHAFEYMIEKEIGSVDGNEYQTFIYSVISDIRQEIIELKKHRKRYLAEQNILNNKDLMIAECKKRFVIKHFKK